MAQRTGAIDRRQFVLRGAVLGFGMTGAGSILAACGGGSSSGSTAARARRAITVSTDAATTLDPAFAAFTSDLMADHAVYEGLVGYEPGTYTVVNQLAETFEQSADGKEIHFRLRPGVPFHDGFGEVTAEDVKFSYERVAGMTKPAIQSPYVADWAPQLAEVRVEGKYEGTIVLNNPFAPLMTTTLPALSGLIVSKQAVLERGDRFATRPVGSGPYRMESFRPNDSVVLRRFDGWKAPAGSAATPAYERITITASGDPTVVDAGLTTGDLDVASLEGSQLKRVEADESLTVENITSLTYDWIGMNVQNPALAELDLRKAIRLGIDVPAIVAAAYDDASPRATAILPPSMGIGYWEDAPVYDRDVDAARQLVAAAGADGRELTLSLGTEPKYFKTVAEIVQANLADIGLKIAIDIQDIAAFAAPGAEALRQLELFVLTFGSFPDPFWSMQWFTTAQIGEGGYNWMSWSNPQFDELNTRAASELDKAKRTEMYIEMQRIWDENANAVWLTWPASIWAARNDVAMKIRPDGLPAVHAFQPA